MTSTTMNWTGQEKDDAMCNDEIDAFMKSGEHDRWLLNGKFIWEFLDSYTFTAFVADENSPSKFSEALGVVFDGCSWFEAKVRVQLNEHGNMYMNLHLRDNASPPECCWSTMITVVNAERTI